MKSLNKNERCSLVKTAIESELVIIMSKHLKFSAQSNHIAFDAKK